MTDSTRPELNPELEPALPLVLDAANTLPVRPSTLDAKNKYASSSGGLQYDSSLADASVRARNLVTDRRFWQMAKTLASFSFEAFSDRIKPKFSKSEFKRRRAVRLRDALVELGPTFHQTWSVSFGQTRLPAP
jgi:hypothetical protein